MVLFLFQDGFVLFQDLFRGYFVVNCIYQSREFFRGGGIFRPQNGIVGGQFIGFWGEVSPPIPHFNRLIPPAGIIQIFSF